MRLLPAAFELMRRDLVRRGVRSVYADVNGDRMHYFDLPGRGTLPPVVLVHGLGGSASGWSRCLFPLARESRRVIAVDMPGSGFSPLPQGGPHGLLELTRVFGAFVDQEIREKIIIVGNSLGGALAARFTTERADALAATVLVAPAGAPVSEARFQQLLQLFRIASVEDARALTRRLFHRPPFLMPALLGPDLFEMFVRPSVTKVVLEADQSLALTSDELSKMSLPLLLLWGKSERVLPYESVEFFRAHLPKSAEIEEVEGFGHVPQLETPKALVARILAFARRRLG